MTPDLDPQKMVGLPYLNMRVVFDDGAEFMTHCDQRDMRRAQAHAQPETDPIGYARATAWAYLTRHELISMNFATFDRDVPFCVPLDDESGGADAADPTETATAD